MDQQRAAHRRRCREEHHNDVRILRCPGQFAPILPGRHAVRSSHFEGGEFIHWADWSVWVQGKIDTSHGCLNVSPANSVWFYKFSPARRHRRRRGNPATATRMGLGRLDSHLGDLAGRKCAALSARERESKAGSGENDGEGPGRIAWQGGGCSEPHAYRRRGRRHRGAARHRVHPHGTTRPHHRRRGQPVRSIASSEIVVACRHLAGGRRTAADLQFSPASGAQDVSPTAPITVSASAGS